VEAAWPSGVSVQKANRVESSARPKEKVSEIETVQHFNDRVDEGIIAAPEKLRSHRTV
jgi:hypothetical protein